MSGSFGTTQSEERKAARQDLERLKKEFNFLEPDRGDLDSPTIKWRFAKPDYTQANLEYMKGKTKNHPAGSLELVVENLVKRWEMEASHFQDLDQWTTINKERLCAQANGGKVFTAEETWKVGNYNWLMAGCKKDLYDAEKEDFESSHRHFRGAFTKGFPWEVLEVFSGPPTVSFSWRHWAHFTGQYMGSQGAGELLEMYGFGVVELDEYTKITALNIYYKPDEFVEALKGDIPPSQLSMGKALVGSGCPYVHSKVTGTPARSSGSCNIL
ncbi:Hypp3657 [Branchiostoma lanceolatum]|uniref:Hypp3657 protein n=1 Tax=Branchiostoma lanceolatum TaxID=7740 RepID=A0A8K0EXP0_BRALA|nr:Hypp3657 [Branchiostoma lanceolatum]